MVASATILTEGAAAGPAAKEIARAMNERDIKFHWQRGLTAWQRGLTASAAVYLAAGLVALAVLADALSASLAQALGAYALIAVGVFWWLPGHSAHRGFGLANGATLLRGVAVALFAGLLGAGAPGQEWLVVAFAAAALALDGVDGWLARRLGSASPFGARFDMEVDALLILALAALVLDGGKAGAWVLAAGGLRYAFVAAQTLAPALRSPLPESRRRKTVCVLQIAALIVCLAPVVPPPLSAALAAASIAVLAWSFALDTVWLLRRRPASALAA